MRGDILVTWPAAGLSFVHGALAEQGGLVRALALVAADLSNDAFGGDPGQ